MGELNPSPDCVTTRSTDLRFRYRPTSSPGFWVLCLPRWSSSLENPWSHNLHASSATCSLTWLSFAFISQWKKMGITSSVPRHSANWHLAGTSQHLQLLRHGNTSRAHTQAHTVFPASKAPRKQLSCMVRFLAASRQNSLKIHCRGLLLPHSYAAATRICENPPHANNPRGPKAAKPQVAITSAPPCLCKPH